MNPPLRSLLFCPATAPRPLAKLPFIGADAVAIDLEDAVTNDRKVDARADVRAVLEQFADVRTYVRVNHPSTGLTEGDIHGVVHPNLDGIVLPKVESAETVRNADAWLAAAEREQGVEVGSTAMLLLIESAKGVYHAVEILSASDRVETGIIGFVDFMLDLGMDLIDTSEDTEELLYARSALVVAARVAGKRPPLDGPFIDIKDSDRFLRQCAQGRQLGFAGKMLIHPSQVPLTHRGFAPPAAEAEQARRVVDQFLEAEKQGVAALVVDGRLVDYPVMSRAKRIVEAYDAVAHESQVTT
ncbi:MAG: CoA ester lyase [Patulibacter sp.]|nr:CoA ester lyase [Patulibacter sp.]